MRAISSGVGGGQGHTGFSPSAAKAVYSHALGSDAGLWTVTGCCHPSPTVRAELALGEFVCVLPVGESYSVYPLSKGAAAEKSQIPRTWPFLLHLVQSLRSAF